jgi:hypothetical protein
MARRVKNAGREDGLSSVCLCFQLLTPAPHLSLSSSKLPLLYPYLASSTALPLAHWLQHVVSNPRQYKKSRAFASCTTHSRPSCKFIPVMALQVMMCHLCVLMASSRSPYMQLALARQPFNILSAVTHLADFVLAHGAGNIALVLEHEQTCTGESLLLLVVVLRDGIHANLFL